MSASIDVRRLCLNYRPAMLVIIYSHNNVLRSHEIDLAPFLFASPENAARELKAEYDMYLHSVNESQLARLMRKVRNYDGSSVEDLNTVSEAELELHKQRMSEKFAENFVKPGDANYVYDKRVEFDASNAEPSDWD